MDTQLLKLPTMGLVLAPFGSGKTSLLRYLCLDSHDKIVAMVIFSKDGRATYESNYDLVNRIYVHDTWDTEIIKKIIKLGQKIKRTNPNHHIFVWFDDFIGMTKGFFDTNEAKELLTTLRAANCTMFISSHQLQNEVTTLIRNNARDIFIFAQSEPNGTKLMYETWGVRSRNQGIGIETLKEFRDMVVKLPKHHFLHFNTDTNVFTEMMTPPPEDMPKFRLYLHPSDLQEEANGYKIVYGNRPNYNLSMLERQIEDAENDFDDDGEPLYREDPTEDTEMKDSDDSNEEEKDSSEEEENQDPIEYLRTATKKRKAAEEEEEAKKKQKGKKGKAHLHLLEEIDKRHNEMNENLSTEDEKLRLKILSIFKVIRMTDNPDKRMLDQVDSSFLKQDFDTMPFEQLLGAYRNYVSHKELDKIVYGTSRKFEIGKNIIHQFARGVLDFEGDPSVFTSHLDGWKHESILSAIAESDPHRLAKIPKMDQFLTVVAPIATGMYSYWIQKKRKEQHNDKLNGQIPDAEADILLDRIDDL